MKKIKIGAGQGFYGDSPLPAYQMALNEDLDYLCFDALAELTLAILGKDRQRNPNAGYTKDIKAYMQLLLPQVAKKRFKIITNAGGLNPRGAVEEIKVVANKLGISNLKITWVEGDDILTDLKSLNNDGLLYDLNLQKKPLENIEEVYFANIYFGVKPVVEALKTGADIVVTGRVTDSSLFLAPLIYEFGWGENDYDRLAQGIILGHLLECSGQSTGGNFSGNWEEYDLTNTGYPLAMVEENGEFIITKTANSGGAVTVETVSEQLLYEIQNPHAYLTPEVVVDLTEITLEEKGKDLVKVKNAKGSKPGEFYKFILGKPNGYLAQTIFGYCWPDCYQKAKAAEKILKTQMERLKISYEEFRVDYLGINSLHLELANNRPEEPDEIILRIALKTQKNDDAQKFLRLIPPLALNGPPGMGGFTGINPPRELVKIEAGLIAKEVADKRLQIFSEVIKDEEKSQRTGI